MSDIDDMTLEELECMWWVVAQEIDRRGGKVDSYAAPHVWNLTAKVIREHFPTTSGFDMNLQRHVVAEIALAFAKRFAEDDGFDPISWLDKASPDIDLFPLSELWNEPDVNDLEF